MSASTTSRLVSAAPEAVFAAFMDPAALVAWLPPGEMTGKVHAFDGRVGGGYSMSLFYPADTGGAPGKAAADEDRVTVRFVEIVPPSRIVEAVAFVSDDPAYGGEMTHTITLEPAPGGTRVTLDFTGLPSGIRPEDNDEGARQSLDQLARWLSRRGADHA